MLTRCDRCPPIFLMWQVRRARWCSPAFLIWQVLQEMVQGLEEELDYRAMQTAQVAIATSAIHDWQVR